MPETPDWAAPPEAIVTYLAGTYSVPQAGLAVDLGLGVAGRRLTVVGVDLFASGLANAITALRGRASLDVLDKTSTFQLAGLAISPGSPFATVRPPFGSVQATASADIRFSLNIEQGTGTQTLGAMLYFYYE